MDGPLNVGIVGTAFAGYLHLDSYRRLPDVKVVAVASRTPEALETFAKKWAVPETHSDYRELVTRDEIALVSVCTPTFLHAKVAIAALEAGKHVVCEKPLATTLADAERMLDTARRTGRRLFYAEDWCFAPALLRAKELIDEGAIGRLLYVKGKECHVGSHSPFAQKIATCGGGSLIHLAIHPIGWASWLIESPVREVFCQTSGGGERNFVHRKMEGEDWAVATMTFESGQRALIEGNYITVGGMDDAVEIYGSDGVLKVELTFGSPMRVYSREGYAYAIEKTDFTHGWTRPAVDEWQNLGYVGEIAHFVECARANREAKRGVRGEDGLAILRTPLALYESATTGRTAPVTA